MPTYNPQYYGINREDNETLAVTGTSTTGKDVEIRVVTANVQNVADIKVAMDKLWNFILKTGVQWPS